MPNIKNPRKQYDTALRPKKGTNNIWMRFADGGIKVDTSTRTPCWDEAQIVVSEKRRQVREQKVYGKKQTVTFDEAWNMYVADNKKHWSASGSTEANDKNMFDRMTGDAIKRQYGKGAMSRTPIYWSAIPVTCLSKIDSSVMLNHYNKRCLEASESQAHAEISFIRRLIKCMHTHNKQVPTLASITIKMKHVKNRRLRIPTPEEVKLIVSHMPKHHADYVLCLALTGSRRQEIAAARYEDIEYDQYGNMVSIWLENTKTDTTYSKPMVDDQGNQLQWTKIIQQRMNTRNHEYEWIFPMPEDPSRHRDHSTEFWHRAIAKTNINSPETLALKKNNGEALVPHHLRHFVGANLAMKGYNESIIQSHLHQADPRSAQAYIDQVQNPVESETMGVMDNLLVLDNDQEHRA